MALEVSIPYVFVGESGARAVLGNGDAALADPDWCGFLDPSTGITGLISGGDVRGLGGDRPGTRGGYAGTGILPARNGTVNGVLDPRSYDPAARNSAANKLTRAVYALKSDGVMTWQPSGSSSPRMIRYRTRSLPDFQQRQPKTFQFTLETHDAVNLATNEQSIVVVPDAAVSELGAPDPLTDPFVSLAGDTVAGLVPVGGDVETFPRFRIVGPIDNPEVVNFTTGERLRLRCSLTASQSLDIVPELGLILLDGITPRYDFLNPSGSSWWTLRAASSQVVSLASSSYGAGAQLTVYWRDAFLS